MRITVKHPERLSEIFEDVTGVCLENQLTGISTDSRECIVGDLYVALIGNQQDGHIFLHDAIKKGAVAALVSKNSYHKNFQQIKVDDPRCTIGEIAKRWRAQFDIPIVCITGYLKFPMKQSFFQAIYIHLNQWHQWDTQDNTTMFFCHVQKNSG